MDVLILVDIQNDFLPGGALEVKHGDQILQVVNRLVKQFDRVLATKDWHPADHKSFASNHQGKNPGDIIRLRSLSQILWPDHCVQQTEGAEFSSRLDLSRVEKIFLKGTDREIDSYSGFYDNGHLKSTGLSEYLKDNRIDKVFIVGLATDYCVKFTALDSVQEGFKTFVIEDAVRAVNLKPGDSEKAFQVMVDSGVRIISSDEILKGKG